jgi:hypothetical protein
MISSKVILVFALQLAFSDRPAQTNARKLPLADRCKIARLVSTSIMTAIDFSQTDPFFSEELRLFISADCRAAYHGLPNKKLANVSLFRKGERCDDILVHRTNPSDPVTKVTVAKGTRDDLPPNETYLFVRTTSKGPRRWQFLWEWNDQVRSCIPKKPVYACWTPLSWPHDLTNLLIMRIAKSRRGDVALESSVIEFRRHPRTECAIR